MTFTGFIGRVCMFPLRAIINACVALGIHPNVLTFVGVLINVGAAVALVQDRLRLGRHQKLRYVQRRIAVAGAANAVCGWATAHRFSAWRSDGGWAEAHSTGRIALQSHRTNTRRIEWLGCSAQAAVLRRLN